MAQTQLSSWRYDINKIRPQRRSRGVVGKQSMQPDRSVRLVQVHGTMVILCNFHIFQIGPKVSKCTVSLFPSDMDETLARRGPLRPERSHLWPNLGPLGSNFCPTWLRDCPALPHLDAFGSIFGPSLRSIWLRRGDVTGLIQNPKNVRFPSIAIFHVFFF